MPAEGRSLSSRAYDLRSTGRWGLVVASIVVACVSCTIVADRPPVPPPLGVPFQPSAVGYDGYMIVHWGAADGEVIRYDVRYRKLEHVVGDPVGGWHRETSTERHLRVVLTSGSYEAQARAHRADGDSAWWPSPPAKTYVH